MQIPVTNFHEFFQTSFSCITLCLVRFLAATNETSAIDDFENFFHQIQRSFIAPPIGYICEVEKIT